VTTTISSQRATGREWAGLAVLALPTLLLSVDIFVLLLALPKIGEQLRASSTQQLWISDSYGFLLAGFLVTMGTLGDRIGRRRLLLIGAAAFGAASVLAAYATSPATLIGGDAERQPDPRCGSPSQGWCCGCAERDKQPAWVRSRHRHSRQRGGCRIPEPCRLDSPVSAAGRLSCGRARHARRGCGRRALPAAPGRRGAARVDARRIHSRPARCGGDQRCGARRDRARCPHAAASCCCVPSGHAGRH